MTKLADLKVKIFADGADRGGMLELYSNPLIKGFTTNPTLMRNAGITDYEAFAREIVKAIPDRPISLRGLLRRLRRDGRQARRIASWGENVYVKIPVTNTQGRVGGAAGPKSLAAAGVKQNVTALMTLAQVRDVAGALGRGPPACVSVFAGRVADTGRDPVPMMAAAVEMLRRLPAARADLGQPPRAAQHLPRRRRSAATIITVTHDLLKKLVAGRQGPRRVLARHREDVPQRRRQGGVQARLSRGTAELESMSQAPVVNTIPDGPPPAATAREDDAHLPP